jgi:predicted nucleotidyltransferase
MKTDFKALLSKLIDHDFEFILIGGFAATSYGSNYVTQDLDVCAVLSPANIELLRKILVDLHPKHRLTVDKLSFLDIPQDLNGINNLYLQTDAGLLDLVSDVIGVGNYEAVSKSAVEVQIFGRKCKIISLEDLIKSKLTLKRDKDLLVAKELEVIHKKI